MGWAGFDLGLGSINNRVISNRRSLTASLTSMPDVKKQMLAIFKPADAHYSLED